MQNKKLDSITKGFRILIALAVIVGVAYWGYTSTRSTSYAGTELNFTLGGGQTVIENPSEEPVIVSLTARGSTASFTVASDELNSRTSSTREGTGSATVHSVELELPPGSTDLYLTRGSDVTLSYEGETRLEATVSPQSTNGARTIWFVVAVVAVGGLYYISRTLEHRWIARLRRALPGQDPGQAERAST